MEIYGRTGTQEFSFIVGLEITMARRHQSGGAPEIGRSAALAASGRSLPVRKSPHTTEKLLPEQHKKEANFLVPSKDYGNKWVVVVGNAASLLDYRFGAFIDAHDVVVRCNYFAINGFEDNVGRKTTHWCVSLSHRMPSEFFQRLHYERENNILPVSEKFEAEIAENPFADIRKKLKMRPSPYVK